MHLNFGGLRKAEVRRIPLPRTRVNNGKKKAETQCPGPYRTLLELAKRSYRLGGGPSISAPYLAAMAMSRPISASSGFSSGGGGMLNDLAGSPISLMRPSMPAGERMNNSLAGPESTEKAWGMSFGPNRYEPGRAFVVSSPT
jgi:hypothetical protein